MKTELEEKEKVAILKQAGLLVERIKEIESSGWTQPWIKNNYSFAAETIGGKKYGSSNQILLNLFCEKNNFKVPVFITFNYIRDNGLRIIKGSKSFPYIINMLKVKDKDGKEIKMSEYKKLSVDQKNAYTIDPSYKAYPIFNIEQTNFAEKHPEAWEQMVERFSIEKHTSAPGEYISPDLHKVITENNWICPFEMTDKSEGYYSLKYNKIVLPKMELCTDKKDFYDKALNAMAHSTGQRSALNRFFGSRDSELYAKEKLVAELSAAYIGSRLGMSYMPRKENAQYLQTWIKQLESDPDTVLSLLEDVKKASNLLEKSVYTSSNLEAGNPDLRPEIISFKKDATGVVHANVREGDLVRTTIVYPRGNEYCFQTGSFDKGNMVTHYLTAAEVAEVTALRNEPLRKIASNSKTLILHGQNATIEYRGKSYNADDVVNTLQSKGINPMQVSDNDYKELLKGRGLQLKKGTKNVFSITKTPTGYGMKVLSVAKEVTKSTGMDKE